MRNNLLHSLCGGIRFADVPLPLTCLSGEVSVLVLGFPP